MPGGVSGLEGFGDAGLEGIGDGEAEQLYSSMLELWKKSADLIHLHVPWGG